MAPTVKEAVKHRIITHGAVSKNDSVLKRKRLHSIVRKITQGPLCETEHEADDFEQCQIKAAQNNMKVESAVIKTEDISMCSDYTVPTLNFILQSESYDRERSTVSEEPREPAQSYEKREESVFSVEGASQYSQYFLPVLDFPQQSESYDREYQSESDCRLIKKKMDRIPERMSQLTLWGMSELVVPVKYNSKMARSFAAVDRTPKEQDRREQNTIAARESRAKMRLMSDILTKAATNERCINLGMKQKLAAQFLYASILVEKLNLPQANFFDLWQNESEAESTTETAMVNEDEVECVLNESNPEETAPVDLSKEAV